MVQHRLVKHGLEAAETLRNLLVPSSAASFAKREHMKPSEFKRLLPGDLIHYVEIPDEVFVVTDNFNGQITAVHTILVTDHRQVETLFRRPINEERSCSDEHIRGVVEKINKRREEARRKKKGGS